MDQQLNSLMLRTLAILSLGWVWGGFETGFLDVALDVLELTL